MGGEEGHTRTKGGNTRGLSIPSSSQGKQFTRQDQEGLPGEAQGSEQIPLPTSSEVRLTGGEPQQRQMTHLRHCLASLRVEPSANCFMLKSVPPAEPSLQSPWRKRREAAVGLWGWMQS